MQDGLTYIIGCILLGVAAIIISIIIPDRILLPKRKKYKERNPEGYIKSCRKALVYLGVYYILLGIIVIFISGNAIYSILFDFMIPILTLLPLVVIVKKYT